MDTDPTLPETQAVAVPHIGPTKRKEWPLVPDMRTHIRGDPRIGEFVAVRTRRGVRLLQVRMIRHARNDRRYLVGMTRKGWCRTAWMSDLVSHPGRMSNE